MKSKAFTLLEAMLAISLTAVVVAAAYGMLYSGTSARRAVTENVLQSRSLALALEQVSRCVESAATPTGIMAGEFTGEDAADGLNDSLTLHTVLDPADSRWSDLRRVRFFVDRDADGTPCLMRGLTSNLLASTAPEEDVQVLCRSVESFQVSCLAGDEWVDAWDAAEQGNTLPAAVRVSLTLAVPDGAADGEDRGPSMERVVMPACATAGGRTGP